MHLTTREIWALVHGLLIGGPFLLALRVDSSPSPGCAPTT
jgi:hypothetical protein